MTDPNVQKAFSKIAEGFGEAVEAVENKAKKVVGEIDQKAGKAMEDLADKVDTFNAELRNRPVLHSVGLSREVTAKIQALADTRRVKPSVVLAELIEFGLANQQ